MNWQRVAVANADTQIAVNSQQFCTKIIDAVLDIQTDQTGKVIAFNPDHSAAKGIATVMSLAQEADEMPSMSRHEFEAYEKVAKQSIHKVEQIIPEDSRQEYEEVIALARQTIDAERDLMLFHEAEAERTKSMNHIIRSVESEFAEYFEQDIAQDTASEKRKDMEVSEIQSPEERETDTVPVAAQDHGSEQGADDKKRYGYPDEVKQHYYVRSEREGEQHRVFYDHKGEREMFVDNGERLRSKQFDAHGVRIMVEAAAHRGWGWYYLSTVLDDYSRYIIAWKLCTNMRTEDVTATIELALQASGCDQAVVRHKPRLLSDNGSCYISDDLAEWLEDKKMDHVRGAPFHPQTQGKIERWHLTMKNRVLLENYYLPGDLERQIGSFVEYYNNQRYHESLNNVTPADVYFGRDKAILRERKKIKKMTIQQRRLQHQKQAA